MSERAAETSSRLWNTIFLPTFDVSGLSLSPQWVWPSRGDVRGCAGGGDENQGDQGRRCIPPYIRTHSLGTLAFSICGD